jgi:hypothetical protein
MAAATAICRPADSDVTTSLPNPLISSCWSRSLEPVWRDVRDTSLIDFSLTEREIEALTWVAKGKSSTDIAVLINVSERTVNFHVNNVIRKLGWRRECKRRPVAHCWGSSRGLVVRAFPDPRPPDAEGWKTVDLFRAAGQQRRCIERHRLRIGAAKKCRVPFLPPAVRIRRPLGGPLDRGIGGDRGEAGSRCSTRRLPEGSERFVISQQLAVERFGHANYLSGIQTAAQCLRCDRLICNSRGVSGACHAVRSVTNWRPPWR